MLEVDPADNMDFRYQIKTLKSEGLEPAGWELIETGKHGEQSIFRFSDEGVLIYHNRHAYDKTFEDRHPESHGIYLQEEICFDAEENMTGWSRWGYFSDGDKLCRTRLAENGRIIDSEYPAEPRFKAGDIVYLLYDTGLIEKAAVEVGRFKVRAPYERPHDAKAETLGLGLDPHISFPLHVISSFRSYPTKNPVAKISLDPCFRARPLLYWLWKARDAAWPQATIRSSKCSIL